MRILFDIGHPAHVHYFRHIIKRLIKEGNFVLVIARDKEMTHMLLRQYEIDFVSRGTGRNSFLGKLSYLVKANLQMLYYSFKFQPDIFIGFGSPYAAQVSFLMGKPSIILDDTENAKFGQLFYKKFASIILSPDCFKPSFGLKHIKFSSYMELCYLHPKQFTPDESILKRYDLSSKETYSILRFVSWHAHHDYGHKGLSIESKIKAVEAFRVFGKVLITSEKELPSELEPYRMKINPVHIHHILAGASLFYGESATMASESAVLGTPAIYLDDVGRGYTKEQEDVYGLVFNFKESLSDQNLSILKGIEILKSGKDCFKDSRISLLSNKINLTEFLYWIIINYPKSVSMMRENSKIQFEFL